MRRVVVGVIVAVVVTGCAGRRTEWEGLSDVSAAAATLAGTWRGVLTGTSLASAHGIVEVPAQLTIGEDGRWTMRIGPAGGTVSSGTMSVANGDLVLGGTMAGAAARPVYYHLEPDGPTEMYGWADTVVGGQDLRTQILLKKVAGPAA